MKDETRDGEADEDRPVKKKRKIDPREGSPHYRFQGTPPRLKTRRRLVLQQQMGMSPFQKRFKTSDGRLIHPTKGFRKN